MMWIPNIRRKFENIARNLKMVDLTRNVNFWHDWQRMGFVAAVDGQEEVFFMTTDTWHQVKARYGHWYADDYGLLRALWCLFKSLERERGGS